MSASDGPAVCALAVAASARPARAVPPSIIMARRLEIISSSFWVSVVAIFLSLGRCYGDGSVEAAGKEAALGDSGSSAGSVDDVEDLVRGTGEGDGVGGIGGDDAAGGGDGGWDGECGLIAAAHGAAEGGDLVGKCEVRVGGGGCGGGCNGAAGEGGADVGGVIGLDRHDAGGRAEIAGGDAGSADERCRAVVGGDAYVLEDECADEEAVEVGEGIEGDSGDAGGGG